MKKTIEVINELQKEGIIRKYAVGGGIAAIIYIEPVLTYDLDILYIPEKEEKGLIDISPIYKFCEEKGYKFEREHIIINEIPVQFIPVYNKLVQEAVEQSVEVEYQNISINVLKPEYSIAIMIQTFRQKDKERIIKFLEQTKTDQNLLQNILKKYDLEEKYNRFIDSSNEK